MTAEAKHAGIRAGDLAVAAVVLVFGLVGTRPAGAHQPTAVAPDALAYALVVLAAVSLVAWRRLPVQVFLCIGVVITVYLALGYPFGPILFSGALAAGALFVTTPLRLALVVAAVDMVLVGTAVLVRALTVGPAGWFSFLGVLLGALVWVALPGAIGFAVRVRREAAVRVRAEQARRAVSEERLRMAQEVHDVVGHGLAVIAMQAGAGLHVLERDPAKAREALRAIQATSRESLDGLRAELAALRGQGTGGADDSGDGDGSPRRPGVGLSDVRMLVERVRSGGLDVRLELDEPAAPVVDAVDLAAYRIVQEALTNVLRHAGPTANARVSIREVRERLLLDISDSGDGPPHGMLSEGSGIAGMRDRAERLGGSLEVGTRASGGVQVTAWLPLHPDSSVEAE